MKPHIAEITISPKKGETQVTRWLVTQSRPYPDLDQWNRWRNDGGLFDKYNQPAQGLDEKYNVYLLRSDFDMEKMELAHSRLDHAGYENNPGGITFRGKPLGEITGEVKRYFGEQDCYFMQSYATTISPSAKDFLKEQVAPGLIAFVQANRESLKEAASLATLEGMYKVIREARAAIDAAEKQIEAAKF